MMHESSDGGRVIENQVGEYVAMASGDCSKFESNPEICTRENMYIFSYTLLVKFEGISNEWIVIVVSACHSRTNQVASWLYNCAEGRSSSSSWPLGRIVIVRCIRKNTNPLRRRVLERREQVKGPAGKPFSSSCTVVLNCRYRRSWCPLTISPCALALDELGKYW